MGMYTGLRFKGIIKEEFRNDIELLLERTNEDDWGACEHQVLKDYSKISRSSFIPFGSLAYMPDCWEEGTGKKDKYDFEIMKTTNGFERYFSRKTGLFCFQCSLKNYESTIEYFLENVVPVICSETIHVESLYEECTVSNLYELKDGHIEELDYGIRYEDSDKYEDEEDYWYMTNDVNDKDTKNIHYKDFDFTKENKYRNN